MMKNEKLVGRGKERRRKGKLVERGKERRIKEKLAGK
jgi:hypothetical protein